MACPGGCTNGAAQIAPPTPTDRQQVLNKVNEVYFSSSGANLYPKRAQEFLLEWFRGDTNQIQQQLHTKYQKAQMENKKQGCKCSVQW